MEKRSGKKKRKAKQPTYFTRLLIDFDGRNPIKWWFFNRQLMTRLSAIIELFPVTSFSFYATKSNHGIHIYIGLEHYGKWPPAIIYALQGNLGDDWIRVLFNIKRETLGWPLEQSNVLFEENEKS